MADNPQPGFPRLVFRVFSDDEGKVYLLWERDNTRTKVDRPVSRETLDQAKNKLLSDIAETEEQRPAKQKALDDKRADANREIEQTLFPFRKGTFFTRVAYVATYIFQGLFALFLVLAFTSAAYKAVQYSSERFPEWLHLGVLSLYAFALAYLIFLIATEQNRVSDLARIRRWFGPRGLLVLPFLILLVAGSVFASFTFFLHKHGRVMLEQCSGRPVTEGSLLDFYMWHFLKLVPLLQINETLKWKEPLCYSQARIGFLILLFQGLVVLPSINTLRFYWKNRQTLNKDYVEYVYDPEWRRLAGTNS
jgi:hypothetical protein